MRMQLNDRELRRLLAVRITSCLNQAGPHIGSFSHESDNPLAELMIFYWIDQYITEPGWLAHIHYNRQEFVELADFLIPEAKQL